MDDSVSSPLSTAGAAVVGRPNREVVMDTTGPADKLRETPAKVEGRLAPIPMLGRNDALIEGGETVPLGAAWKPGVNRLEDEPMTGVGNMDAEEAAAEADDDPRSRKN